MSSHGSGAGAAPTGLDPPAGGRGGNDRNKNNRFFNGVYHVELDDKYKHIMQDYRTQICSGSASIISTFVSFPLDFVKSRMQSFETKFVPTVMDAAYKEGYRAFFRGVVPPMISVTVVRTISFSIYQYAKYGVDAQMLLLTGESPLDVANTTGRYPTLSTMTCFAAAGALSGAIVTTLACPFELCKLSAQIMAKIHRDGNPDDRSSTAAKSKYGAFRTAQQLIKNRGVRGLYCGYNLHLLRDTVGTAIYFTTYESAKQLFGNAQGGAPNSPFAVMAGGALCGIVSWMATYPVDVAKTVYQKALLAKPKGHVPIPKIEFFKVTSYRGLGVSLARSAVINMVFFSLFENFKKRINGFEFRNHLTGELITDNSDVD